MTRIFKLEANCTFEAEDIEAAFLQLAMYFNTMYDVCLGVDAEKEDIIIEGYCKVHLKEYD